jgi:serine/threonine protein kinase
MENIMISEQGHIKLIDFGFSKVIGEKGRAQTPCGTADYMAPEIIHKLPYSLEVDIWTYGILLCEMIGGFTPFHDADEETMFRKIIHSDLTWPKNIDKIAKDLISKILVTDPIMRISIKEIKSHPFFESIDWGKAARR